MFEGNDVQNAFAFLSSRLKSTTVQKVQVCFREEAAPRQQNRIENGKFNFSFRSKSCIRPINDFEERPLFITAHKWLKILLKKTFSV